MNFLSVEEISSKDSKIYYSSQSEAKLSINQNIFRNCSLKIAP